MKVLFLCTANSARSQMAEGLANALGKSKIQAFSAGTNPGALNPYAVKVLAEIGIDISKQYAKGMNQFLNEQFDYVITLCDSAKQTCPVFHGNVKRLHWSIADPAHNLSMCWAGPTKTPCDEKEVLTAFRSARDQIRELIVRLLETIRN